MGATCGVHVLKTDSGKDVALKVAECLGSKPTITIETSGAEASLQAAIYVRM